MSDSRQRKSRVAILAIAILLLFPVWELIRNQSRRSMGHGSYRLGYILTNIELAQDVFKGRHNRFARSIAELSADNEFFREELDEEYWYTASLESTDTGYLARAWPKNDDGSGKAIGTMDQTGKIQTTHLPISWSYWLKKQWKVIWKVIKWSFLFAWPPAALISFLCLVIIGKRKVFRHSTTTTPPSPAP